MVTRVTKPLTMVRGRRYRLTRLDACGNPAYGDNGNVVTSGVVTAAFTRVTTEVDEIRTTNTAGETCVFEPGKTNLEGYSGEITLCGLDPDMFNIATGVPVVYDVNGVAVGVAVDTSVNTDDFAFALEIWTGLASDDACGELGEVEYGYILLPFMKGGTIGDFSVENGAINMTISGATSRKGGSWGKGPYHVVENAGSTTGPLLTALTSTQVLLFIRTNVAPPAATDGSRPTLDPSWVTLASVTVDSQVDLEVDFEVSPVIPVDEGVYYDFGDGVWAYELGSVAGGAITHEYAEPGTYTVTANANGKVVTTTVTVTEGS